MLTHATAAAAAAIVQIPWDQLATSGIANNSGPFALPGFHFIFASAAPFSLCAEHCEPEDSSIGRQQILMQAHSATIIDDLTDLTAVDDWQLGYSSTSDCAQT